MRTVGLFFFSFGLALLVLASGPYAPRVLWAILDDADLGRDEELAATRRAVKQ